MCDCFFLKGHHALKCHHALVNMFTFYRVGPLIRHWTMRYEAKHQYFKQLASTMGYYNNIAYSLAMRHQCLQCYLHASGASISADDQQMGKGKQNRMLTSVIV